jgi:coproporphyrinogen III oxidase-like Fe-S oxidoreductase
METRDWLRSRIAGMLLGERKLALKSEAFALSHRFDSIDSLGLYLHIPFCRQICPYCPYNKELFHVALAERYTEAVLKEIDRYSVILGGLPVTTFYIGGGTPTTMLHTGLPRILEHIYHRLNMQCGIHMESHPNDLSPANLSTIVAMGVEHLSIGIEALQDRHLRTLCRPYTAAEAAAVIANTLEKGFECVNVDLIFALPDQTHEELELSARMLIELGVDQIAAYPLFSFPYTQWPQLAHQNHYRSYSLLWKRRMLQVLLRHCAPLPRSGRQRRFLSPRHLLSQHFQHRRVYPSFGRRLHADCPVARAVRTNADGRLAILAHL